MTKNLPYLGAICIPKRCINAMLHSFGFHEFENTFVLVSILPYCDCNLGKNFSITFSTNPTKWSNTLKQFIQFVGLALKG